MTTTPGPEVTPTLPESVVDPYVGTSILVKRVRVESVDVK